MRDLQNLDHLIGNSKDSDNFLSSISEIRTAYLLREKVDDLKIIISKKPSPDFQIKKLNIEITIEVKMIRDKFSNKKLMKNETLIKGKYLFSWDGIPGTDNGKLIEIIEQRHNIDWLKTAKIEKIDNDRSIKISNEINFLSLRLNDKKTKADLIIDDIRTDEEFITKTEKGRLNVYLGDKVYEIDDVATISNAIEGSIEKGQYYPNIPHIIVFDCSATAIEGEEFESILYPQKDNENIDDGLYYKKSNIEFSYHMISGIVAIFGRHYFNECKNEISKKRPRMIFFENPNASKKVHENIISMLGIQFYKVVS